MNLVDGRGRFQQQGGEQQGKVVLDEYRCDKNKNKAEKARAKALDVLAQKRDRRSVTLDDTS